VDSTQFEILERRKRRIILGLGIVVAVMLVLSALRFIPRLNDAVSGKPQYVRALTETFARQFASQTQMQFPVIVEHDEQATCQPVNAPPIADQEIRGTIYLLGYSEQQHVTCITAYIVPTDASRFSTLRTFTPAEGKNYGPILAGTVEAFAEERIIHPYAAEYLNRLHWRYKPHFPLSPKEAASLTSQSYYSGAKPPSESLSVDLDYGELRAEIGARHQKLNLALSSLLGAGTLLCLFLMRKLWLFYLAFSKHCGLYEAKVTPRDFLNENIAMRFNAARQQYFERQEHTQARLREQESLRALRNGWEQSLRAALPNLADEQLHQRVQEYLACEPQDVEQMKSLWLEVQERTSAKTPADKLNLLLESAKPYCTDEEVLADREEAFAILNKSGFRDARAFAIALHDQYKTRAREIAEMNADRAAKYNAPAN
jgi:hypothetical protein